MIHTVQYTLSKRRNTAIVYTVGDLGPPHDSQCPPAAGADSPPSSSLSGKSKDFGT
jgi:hypothetical protein